MKVEVKVFTDLRVPVSQVFLLLGFQAQTDKRKTNELAWRKKRKLSWSIVSSYC